MSPDPITALEKKVIGDVDYGTPDNTGPFRPAKLRTFRPDDPGDQGRENEALKDINKPKKREIASHALEQNIPCGMNKSRDDH